MAKVAVEVEVRGVRSTPFDGQGDQICGVSPTSPRDAPPPDGVIVEIARRLVATKQLRSTTLVDVWDVAEAKKITTMSGAEASLSPP